MSTNDVPGANPANQDRLAMGCWAEHEDGSLLYVQDTEGGRVVYFMFNLATNPVTEYRDGMAEGAFKKAFSWNPKDPASEKWTWHDKTPFPWDKIIKAGARDGVHYPSADDQLNAAERVRRSREIHSGREVDISEIESRVDQLGDKAERIIRRLQRALSGLPKGKGKQ